MKRICVIGSFSGRNIGDDAIIRGTINFLSQQDMEFYLIVLTKFPKYFNGFSPHLVPVHSRIGLLSLNTFLQVIRSDLTLIPQGSLFSYQLLNPFYNRVLTYYLIIIINRLFAKRPIGLFLGGIGPIKNKASAFFIKEIVKNFDFLLFRDRVSISYLQNMGIQKEYSVAGDIALFCDRENNEFVEKIRKQVGQQRAMGINVNKYSTEFLQDKKLGDDLLTPLASFIRVQAGRYFFIFMPTDIEDIETTKDLIETAGLQLDSYILVEKCRPEEYIEIQSICQFFIGARMHSLIMSAVAGTPFIGLNYNPKVLDFMELVNLSSYCIEYDELSEARLISAFTKITQSETELRDILKKRVAELKQTIKLTLEEKIICYLK